MFLYYVPYILFTDNSAVPQWGVSGTLDERITSEVKQIKQMVRTGERIGEGRDVSYNSQDLNLSKEASFYGEMYCSSNLVNKIEEVQSRSGINLLYIRGVYDRNNVPIETFLNYIEENNIKCLIPDAYTFSDGVRIRFLEPFGKDATLWVPEGIFFYEKSNLLTALYILKIFFQIIAIFAGIAILYYKVLLFIVFGSKKVN